VEVDVADSDALVQAIEVGDRATAVRLTQEAVDETLPQVVLDAMTEAMAHVGTRFQRNEISVPEMPIAARAMKEATAVLEPLLVRAGIRPSASAVIGIVKGHLPEIGKNLAAMMWSGANIEVIDIGTNVLPERFAAAVRAADLADTRVLVGGLQSPPTSPARSERTGTHRMGGQRSRLSRRLLDCDVAFSVTSSLEPARPDWAAGRLHECTPKLVRYAHPVRAVRPTADPRSDAPIDPEPGHASRSRV
jgi:hypothetical protein